VDPRTEWRENRNISGLVKWLSREFITESVQNYKPNHRVSNKNKKKNLNTHDNIYIA